MTANLAHNRHLAFGSVITIHMVQIALTPAIHFDLL